MTRTTLEDTTMNTPEIAFVVTTLEPADDYRPAPSYVVTAHWAGVERPEVHSISCGQNQKLAQRLADAIASGKVYTDAEVKVDVDGNTYVAATSRVMGRHLNADLKRLGF